VKVNPILAGVFLVSLIVWLLVSAAAGGREAWDTSAYWSVGLPVIYLVGGLAAYVGRATTWSIALWSGLGQFAGLLLTASGFSLWPLGMMMLAVLTLPVLATAAVARWLRVRFST
jgi:hypothetical protein